MSRSEYHPYGGRDQTMILSKNQSTTTDGPEICIVSEMKTVNKHCSCSYFFFKASVNVNYYECDDSAS